MNPEGPLGPTAAGGGGPSWLPSWNKHHCSYHHCYYYCYYYCCCYYLSSGAKLSKQSSLAPRRKVASLCASHARLAESLGSSLRAWRVLGGLLSSLWCFRSSIVLKSSSCCSSYLLRFFRIDSLRGYLLSVCFEFIFLVFVP